MQIPILQGIYTDTNGNYRSAYPINMMPVPMDNGISKGYLKPADGIVQFSTNSGIDRGGINWNDECYRVMGSKLVKIDSSGTETVLGDIGAGTSQATLTYSFDRLAIGVNDKLYYYNSTIGLVEVTDTDLGTVRDVTWVDGYFMTTDGEFLVVTDLTDPLSVNPLKYGSSEAAPDPIVALVKLKNEIYALNRYTIEVFDNVGGTNFPFARIESAQIERGCVGTHACSNFMESIAFIGGGENEGISVWLAANASSIKIATNEIDYILAEYTETQLSNVVMEHRVDKNHELLYIHLPDKTLVFDGKATAVFGNPVWFILSTSLDGNGIYNARNLVYCYDKWLCGNPSSAVTGYLSESVMTHYATNVGWEFSTSILYNESNGAIIHSLELVGLPGNVALGANPTIWTSYTKDGKVWSVDKPILAGTIGDYSKRIVWFQQGHLRNYRIQKFKGSSDAKISFARLEARIEALYV